MVVGKVVKLVEVMGFLMERRRKKMVWWLILLLEWWSRLRGR